MSSNDYHYGLRLPTELHDRLTERARAEARTPAALLRMLAELYLDTPEGQPIYPPGTPPPHPPA